MGKKLGAAFIIYGIINLIASVVLLAFIPPIGIGGIVWSIVFIAVGSWMRGNAKRNELLKQIAENTKKNEEEGI